MSSERLLETRIRHLMAARPAAKFLDASGDRSREALAPSPDSRYQHVDGNHEFAFVVSGRARVRTPQRDFILSPGELLLIGAGVEHMEAPVTASQPYTVFWCALDHTYALMGETSFVPPDAYTGTPRMQLHGRTNVQSLAVAVASELQNRAWGWHRSAQALLQYLGCILIRRIHRGQSMGLSPSESPTVAHDPRMWEVVQRALEFCRANFDQSVRVEEVAAAVGYSASRLSHLFSSYLGESVSDHLRGLRLAHARDLLENTDSTVADIAQRIGYGDPAHFTRAFVRTYGFSPSSFRQQLRGQ